MRCLKKERVNIMFQIAFDNQKYIRTQSEHILKRIQEFGTKLYLEFGGKLFDDAHASRVLPGFQPDSKLQMLLQLKEEAEIVISISAEAIEQNKRRGDSDLSYDAEVLRLIDAFRSVDLYVSSVVITHYTKQASCKLFCQKLKQKGVKTYFHYVIEGYPHNVSKIVSDEGYGKNDYVETSRPLVVVTAPGPGSGKMATCLSQLYHEHKRGIQAGYAKFETFPIWNLPLKHPVNLAYEAATVDLKDINMIDPFHLEAYGEIAINYNRDIEVYPVLKAMLEKIMGECPYKSPTDMGVNRAGFCIVDDAAACKASGDEIVRRYYQTRVANKEGKADASQLEQLESLMSQAGVNKEDRKVVQAALNKEKLSKDHAFSLQLHDGTMVTGRRSELLGSVAACVLNALKHLGKIQDKLPLITPNILGPITDLKVHHLGNRNPRLHLDEVLIALAVSATTNPLSHAALEELKHLHFCEAHSTVMLDAVDRNVLRKLGVHFTEEPVVRLPNLYKKNNVDLGAEH